MSAARLLVKPITTLSSTLEVGVRLVVGYRYYDYSSVFSYFFPAFFCIFALSLRLVHAIAYASCGILVLLMKL